MSKSKEMVKISFNDWREIGSKLYDSDPEGFKKQAEEAGLEKESGWFIPVLLGLAGYEATKAIGGWLSKEFKGSATSEFATNYTAQDQAFEVMSLLEQSPELRQTVVGAEKLHNRLQELSGTIKGLRNYMGKMYDKKKAEDKKTEQAETDKGESAEIAKQMAALTADPKAPATTVAPAATAAPAAPAKSTLV